MADVKRILIVDDEESMRLLLRRVLESNPKLEIMADAPTKLACASLGVSDYLAKPIHREAVLAAVNSVITG